MTPDLLKNTSYLQELNGPQTGQAQEYIKLHYSQTV